MANQDDWIRINFRLPPDLHKALKTASAENKTSMNAEVIQRLEQSIHLDETPDEDIQAFGRLVKRMISEGSLTIE